MNVTLLRSKVIGSPHIVISGSKSETNRLLLLQALYPEIKIENNSESDDSIAMDNALRSAGDIIDVGHAGTAMRFLTAYFAIAENRAVILTGSDRMQQRPIGILVAALRQLGAKIEYLQADGFPPLKITGTKIVKSHLSLRADVSSQFISALLLIAPKLENGLELTLEGEITSRPYIGMTLALLHAIGVETRFENQLIRVEHLIQPTTNDQRPATSDHQPATDNQRPPTNNHQLTIESDWSSASYFYSIIALSEIGTEVKLSTFKKNSFQGDSALAGIYKNFGVETIFEQSTIIVRKANHCQLSIINCQLQNNPDLAQTIAVTAFALGIECKLTGLHTLRIKETDRLAALKAELEKLGATVEVTGDSVSISPGKILENIAVETYDDHRMAMAFSPLATKVPIVIKNAGVVSKSYPAFWNDLKAIGFNLETA
jgi:3-phosphoshikimate 1-carboxyvinyltransferase